MRNGVENKYRQHPVKQRCSSGTPTAALFALTGGISHNEIACDGVTCGPFSLDAAPLTAL